MVASDIYCSGIIDAYTIVHVRNRRAIRHVAGTVGAVCILASRSSIAEIVVAYLNIVTLRSGNNGHPRARLFNERGVLNQYVPAPDVKAVVATRNLYAIDDQTVDPRGATIRLKPARSRADAAKRQNPARMAGDVYLGIIAGRHDQGLAPTDLCNGGKGGRSDVLRLSARADRGRRARGRSIEHRTNGSQRSSRQKHMRHGLGAWHEIPLADWGCAQ